MDTGKIILLITFFTLAVTGVRVKGAEEGSLSWEDYRVIAQRNIFSKNRTKKVKAFYNGNKSSAVTEQKEESYLVLRGITKLGDSFTAFIEDTRSMEVRQVKEGAVIAGGKVSEINIDFLIYESGGKNITVKMGMAMEGHETSGISGRTSGGGISQSQGLFSFSSDKSTKNNSSVSDDKKSILQRLKERRKKELGE
jgi:hypothetical protein